MAATGRRSFEANPLSAGDGAMAAIGLTWQGKPEEALRLVDKVLQVEPGDRFGLVAKSQALVSLGRLDEAGRLLKRCEPLEADLFWDAELWRQVRFQLAVAKGDTATAEAFADRASKLWLGPESRNLDGNAAWTMIPGLMRMGRREDALRLLEKGVELYPNAEGYLQLFIHPDLHPLRKDQRFLRLLEKGKKDVALALRMLHEAKSSGDLPAHFDGPMAQLQELLNRTFSSN